MGEASNSVATFLDEQTLELNGTMADGTHGKVKFNFDKIFNSDTKQVTIFESAVKPIVQGVMEGFNGTVFAYGQTSSGKTFTM